MLVSVEEGKPENLKKDPRSKNGNQQQTQVQKSNPGHTSGRRVPSPLCHAWLIMTCSHFVGLCKLVVITVYFKILFVWTWICKCVVPENIHTPPHRRDWKFLEGGGFWKTKKFKEMYGVYLEFPERWGVLIKNPFRGRGMDILWNYTISIPCFYF